MASKGSGRSRRSKTWRRGGKKLEKRACERKRNVKVLFMTTARVVKEMFLKDWQDMKRDNDEEGGGRRREGEGRK